MRYAYTMPRAIYTSNYVIAKNSLIEVDPTGGFIFVAVDHCIFRAPIRGEKNISRLVGLCIAESI